MSEQPADEQPADEQHTGAGRRYTMIDTEELAVRMAEAMFGKSRPEGATARQALDSLGAAGDGFSRAAIEAAEYIAECMNAAGVGVEMRKVLLSTEREQ